jgi:hypothetical protein
MKGGAKLNVWFVRALAAGTISWFSFSSVMAQDAPYQARWLEDDLVSVKRLEFIVMADELLVSNVRVNRGNCPIATNLDGAVELSVNDAFHGLAEVMAGEQVATFPQKHDPKAGFPMRGLFGESLSVFVPLSCNILLVEIETPDGNWSTKFTP